MSKYHSQRHHSAQLLQSYLLGNGLDPSDETIVHDAIRTGLDRLESITREDLMKMGYELRDHPEGVENEGARTC